MRFSASSLSFVFFAAAALLIPQAALAVPVLDQSNLGILNAGGGIGPGVTGGPIVGQAFTVGVAGTLHSIAVAVADGGASSPLQITLHAASGGLPVGSALASYSIPAAMIPDGFPSTGQAVTAAHLVTIDFSASDLAIDAGEQYVFALSGPLFYSGGWYGAYYDTYVGGAVAFGINGAYSPGVGFDMFFQTFVDVAAVPEPASLALLGAGLLGLGGLARRRR